MTVDASLADAPTIDAADGDDAAAPDAMVDATPPADADLSPSGLLRTARMAADGAVNLPINGAFVTYTKVAVGNDLAGFFVQAEQAGPALFIAVDPSTLTPVPAVGDEVSFDITTMATSGMLRQATAISGLTVDSSANDLSGLVKDVTAATDLITALGDYESELISVTGTISSDLGSLGSGHVGATIDITNIAANTDLKLRVPSTLADDLDLASGCTVAIDSTPMWRFNATAQVSAWVAADITPSACPAPTVVSAVPSDGTTVVVTFDRHIEPTSVLANGSQFTIDNSLTVSAATVSDKTVTLTTSPQALATNYTVTVANTVLDTLANAVVGPNNTATFYGFGTGELICDDGLDDDSDSFFDCHDTSCTGQAPCNFLEQLYLWEVDSDTPGTDVAEFIEVRNMATTDITLDSYYLLFLNGSATNEATYRTVALTGTLTPGSLFVVGNTSVPGATEIIPGGSLQNGADGVLLVHCPTCLSAADIPNGTDVGTSSTFTVGVATMVTKIDGLAYDTSDADDTDLMMHVGVTVQYDENGNAAAATDALQRTSITGWTARPAGPNADDVEP